MKEIIELVRLSQSAFEGHEIVQSKRLTGYQYVVSLDDYEKLKDLFGGDDDCDEAFAEDRVEWLVQLFNASNFEEMEAKVIDYFGNEQKAVAYMAVNSPLRGNSLEDVETRTVHEPLSTPDSPEPVPSSPEQISAVSSADEDAVTVQDTLTFLRTVENPALCGVFLGLFSKNVIGKDPALVQTVFDYLLQGLLRADQLVPDSTEQLIGEIMTIFIKEMEGV